MIIAIDPGNRTGIAALTPPVTLETRSHLGALEYLTTLRERDTVVIERPVIYPRGRTRNPNVIVELALKAGALFGVAYSRGAEVRYVLPREWGGGVPKKIKHARIAERVAQLGWVLPERTSEHARDALGILLWAYDRFGS